MNDKLCKHVNILFAAAPKNQKAEEIKEELLTNLNDKYNDLLANGYDSTAAFHIALSGIGDIDELLKECGGTVEPDTATSAASGTPKGLSIPVSSLLPENVTRMLILLGLAFVVLLLMTAVRNITAVNGPGILNIFGLVITGVLVFYAFAPFFTRRSNKAVTSLGTPPVFPAPEFGEPVQANTPPQMAFAVAPTIRRKDPTSLLVFLAIILFFFGTLVLLFSEFNGIQIDDRGIWTAGMRIDDRGIFINRFASSPRSVNLMLICWAAGIALIAFAIIHSFRGYKEETIQVPWETATPSTIPPPTLGNVTKEDITFKRIVAGILAILLGVFGVHKFYLGFTGAGLIMLLMVVLSVGILCPVTAIIGFIEGILYLLKSDRDFYRDYEIRGRRWF